VFGKNIKCYSVFVLGFLLTIIPMSFTEEEIEEFLKRPVSYYMFLLSIICL